jgi:hypothetical protein
MERSTASRNDKVDNSTRQMEQLPQPQQAKGRDLLMMQVSS